MDTVMIATFRYRHEAEFAGALLESEGIGYVLVGDDAGGMRPEIMSVNPIRLYVAREDADRAARVIAEEDSDGQSQGGEG